MTKFITLKMVSSNDRNDRERDRDVETHADPIQGSGEDDGLEGEATGTITEAPVLPWRPLTISVDSIRNFYPRSGGRPGCRVLMKSGGVAYAVLDEHADIMAMING